MKAYLSKSDAVIDLHERGFTEDFELFGTNLLWIQEQIFLRPGDFTIVEYHNFLSPSNKSTVIFGVAAKNFNAKGILMDHYKAYTSTIPGVINTKLKQIVPGLLHQAGNYNSIFIQ